MIGLPGAVSVRIPSPQLRIEFRSFFDRKAVVDRLGREKVKSLKRAGYKTMQIARRSITKQGMAKPQLRVMKENPGKTLDQIVSMPGLSKRSREAALKRLREVQSPEASNPGSPPFTHTGMFRNHIVFHFDAASESVVVGQAMPRGDWLANLHEFGGVQSVKAWALVPKYQPYRSPILTFMRAGRSPKNASRWRQTTIRDMRRYPARPYMRPAVLTAASSGAIVNSFRMGG